jgi:hypothetical protein
MKITDILLLIGMVCAFWVALGLISAAITDLFFLGWGVLK